MGTSRVGTSRVGTSRVGTSLIGWALSLLLFALPAHATQGYAKKEMKPCIFCHATAKGGGENNARGLYYAKNSYSLAGFVEPPIVPYPKRGIVSDLRDRSGSGWEVTPKKVGDGPSVTYEGETMRLEYLARRPGTIARLSHRLEGLKDGETYTLWFTARASQPYALPLIATTTADSQGTVRNIGLEESFGLTTEDRPFAVQFTANNPDPEKNLLLFSIAKATSESPVLWISNVNLVVGAPKPPPPGLFLDAADDDASKIPDFGRAYFGGVWFVKIPAGTYTRGLTATQKSALQKAGLWSRLAAEEQPARPVRISKPFFISETEVTQAQWKKFRANPSAFKGDTLPVDSVSWDDSKAYCQWLSKRSRATFRLPTEAEWEYAARAGSTGLFPATKTGEATLETLPQLAWVFANAGQKSHPVGKKAPTAWGLFDVCGNVWEWCEDSYVRNFYATSLLIDPLARDPSATERVLRGGCFALDPAKQRVGQRGGNLPSFKSPYVGFRIVRD